MYTASQNGKIFKTVDHGENWTAIGENYDFQGDTWDRINIAVAPSDPNIVYITSGIIYGNGSIWKSIDGGIVWTRLHNLSTANRVDANTIIIHPTDPITVYLAGNNIYKSTNGLLSYDIVRAGGARDIRFKTDDPNTLFALVNDVPNNRQVFVKSTDAGANWTESITGWFSTTQIQDGGGRMTVSTGNPNLIYCIILGEITGGTGENIIGIAKSTDAGATWTTPIANTNPTSDSDTDPLKSGQGYYDLDIEVSDQDDNLVYVGITGSWKTTNGFATVVAGLPNQHADTQEVHFNGSNDMWVASDGGIDLYNATLTSNTPKNRGLTGTEFWGFDQGWNFDTQVGSYYHNGESVRLQSYPSNDFQTIGGGEPATGYVSLADEKKAWFSYPGGVTIPNTINTNPGFFTYGKYPNEDYWEINRRSEIVHHPYHNQTQFLGRDNILWKTTNNGSSFSVLYTFGSISTDKVTSIEVSRVDPNLIYLFQRVSISGGNIGKLWRSTDGGISFTEIAQPVGVSTGNGLFISLDPNKIDNLWIAYFQGGTSMNRVFKSTDAAATWQNITTTTLNNLEIKGLTHIAGTNGGVYLMTKNAVFYRNNSQADWQTCNENLPLKFMGSYIKPFYRDGKIRMATFARGLWSAPFYEAPSKPIAQPTVNKLVAYCPKDTIYFEDYSSVNHATATWNWSFSPAPAYISSTTARNPKVVFGSIGNFSCTLTVTDATGTDTKAITDMVSISAMAECLPEIILGKALQNPTGGNYFITPPISLGSNTDQITLMAWVRPIVGVQSSFSGIISNADQNVVLGVRNNNELGLTYNDSQWRISSGVILPQDKWSHIALVAAANKLKLYYNGNEIAGPYNSYDPPALNFDNKKWRIGNDRGMSGRNFKGSIDEVAIYGRGLTASEIREQMHHFKDPATDPSLKGYFQFNEANENIYNKASTEGYFGTKVGVPNQVISTAPIGIGNSDRMSITTGGLKSFPNEGLDITFPTTGTLPAGEITVTRIENKPDALPSGGLKHSENYWVINNYSQNNSPGSTPNNGTIAPIENMTFTGFGSISTTEAADPNIFKLYKRDTGHDTQPTWAEVGTGSTATAGTNGVVSFNNPAVSSFSQFTIASTSSPLPITLVTFEAKANSFNSIMLSWSTAQEHDFSHFEIERSTDAKTFQKIGERMGKNSLESSKYEFTDVTTKGNLLYYRLKMVDRNGKSQFSAIRAVTMQPEVLVNVAPNPVTFGDEMLITVNDTDQYELKIMDASGKFISQNSFKSSTKINAQNLPKGLYLIELKSSKNWKFVKFIVE
jgi:hypothetical protein